MKNYLKLKSLIPFRQEYIFLDTEPYTVDRIFIANKLYVKFKEEYRKKEFPRCVLIHCWVLKKKSKVFEKRKGILHDQLMLSCGKSYTELLRNMEIFSRITKCREPALMRKIAVRTREQIRKICQANDVEILAGCVGKDHIHLLVSVSPHLSADKLARYMKRNTS